MCYNLIVDDVEMMSMLKESPIRVRMSPEEFDEWVMRPENVDRLFELIDGFVVEKNVSEDGQMVSHFDSAELAQVIGTFLRLFLMTNPIGRLGGADGGFLVGAMRYIPDVGFIRHDRFPEDYTGGYVSVAPDLAVEVISATDHEKNTLIKLGNYLAAKTVVWVVYPQAQEIQVYTPGVAPKILTMNDTLTGGEVLPGFSLSVRDIFKPLLKDE